MTRVPMGSNTAHGAGIPFGPKMLARYDNVVFNQGVGAEMIAKKWGLSRTQLDEFSASSHEKAAAAISGGALRRSDHRPSR